LDDLEDVHFANLTAEGVVRHRLVGEIVNAYERYDARTPKPTHAHSPRPRR
jgi:phosphate starvation-inducible PhoH-like protein